MKKTTFSKTLQVIISLLLFSSGFIAVTLSGTPADKQPAGYKFPTDEEMVYNVKALGLTIGTQTNLTKGIVEIEGRRAVNVISLIKSHPWIKFYSIENSMETWIDAETLKPLRYEERAVEKDWRAVETVNFGPDRLVFHTLKGLELDREEKGERGYTEWPQDELSVIYYVRHLDLKPGAVFRINSCVDNALETAVVKVEKTQKLKTIHGKKDVFYITSTLGDARFYLGADDARIPYMFEVKLNVGTMKAALKSYTPETAAK